MPGWKGDVVFRLRPTAEAEVKAVSAQGMVELCEEIIAGAKRRSPVAKEHGGTNRRSINPDGVRIDPQTLAGEIVTMSGYGGYLEVGTRRMPARPYIVPAAEEARSKLGL